MDLRRFHLIRGEQEAIDAAITIYFEEHPELNPERVSVELRPDGEGGYIAVGHTVVGTGAVVELPVEREIEIPLDQLAEDAFIAYANRHDNTNHTMDVAEGWANQGDVVRAAFYEAARAVRDRVLGKPLPEIAPGLAHIEPGQ